MGKDDLMDDLEEKLLMALSALEPLEGRLEWVCDEHRVDRGIMDSLGIAKRRIEDAMDVARRMTA